MMGNTQGQLYFLSKFLINSNKQDAWAETNKQGSGIFMWNHIRVSNDKEDNKNDKIVSKTFKEVLTGENKKLDNRIGHTNK